MVDSGIPTDSGVVVSSEECEAMPSFTGANCPMRGVSVMPKVGMGTGTRPNTGDDPTATDAAAVVVVGASAGSVVVAIVVVVGFVGASASAVVGTSGCNVGASGCTGVSLVCCVSVSVFGCGMGSGCSAVNTPVLCNALTCSPIVVACECSALNNNSGQLLLTSVVIGSSLMLMLFAGSSGAPRSSAAANTARALS